MSDPSKSTQNDPAVAKVEAPVTVPTQAPASTPAPHPSQTALVPASASAPAPAQASVSPPASAPAISVFAEQEANLFDLYTRFRFNELVCLHLSRKASNLEKWVRRSVVGVLAISLFTPVIPGMDEASLKWVWEGITVLATLLGIYSMIVGSGAKQFEWFRRATQFRTWASKLESFSTQVKRGKVSEAEFDETWDSYIHELNRLLEEGGIEFDEFVNQNRDPLTTELQSALKAENKV